MQAERLKIWDSHLTCKVANKYLNVRERVEVAQWNKKWSPHPLLSCESSVSVKENPDRKKISKNNTKASSTSVSNNKIVYKK